LAIGRGEVGQGRLTPLLKTMKKITTLYALEISGKCNLACDYCPYHLQQRERGLMAWDTLKQTFSLGWKLNEPLHLHLFGEPLLHPEFVEMARWIQERYAAKLSFSTNCTLLTSQWANDLMAVRWEWVTLSPHSPEHVAKAAISLQARGIKAVHQKGPDHNWAGQVEHNSKWALPCEFPRGGKAVVRWNGDVALCCITDNGKGVIGTVWDEGLLEQEHKPFELCESCHLDYNGKRHAYKRRMVGDVETVYPVSL
jgi:hypothetical protein